MIEIPNSQRALKVRGPKHVELTNTCAIRQPQNDEILVRVVCVAINPADAKAADLSPILGATLGCDFSGEVVKIGCAVKKTLVIGDRVCGCVYGNHPGDHDNGAFADFIAVPGDLVYRLPSHMSYQIGASLGVGLSTVGMALYHGLKLPYPVISPTTPSESKFVLVCGGATATGSLAIQMICKSGLIPVVTCSPRSFSFVKALGAVEAFDYHSASCGSSIRAFTQDTLGFAFDCITDTGTMKICYEAIGSKGGKYIALDPFPIRMHTRRNVKPDWVITFTMFNKALNLPRPFGREAKPKDREFAERWFELTQRLLDADVIITHPIEERGGGLKGVLNGVDKIRKGEVSGVKLVYKIA